MKCRLLLSSVTMLTLAACVREAPKSPAENLFFNIYPMHGASAHALQVETERQLTQRFRGQPVGALTDYITERGGRCFSGRKVVQCVFDGEFSRLVSGTPPLSTAHWDVRMEVEHGTVLSIAVVATEYNEPFTGLTE